MDKEKITWHWFLVAILAGIAWAFGTKLADKVWPDKAPEKG